MEYAPGTTEEVALHDGSTLKLAKLAADYDPFDRIGAMNYLQSRAAAGELVTGLIYMDSGATRHARQPQHGCDAAQPPVGKGTLPRSQGIGSLQCRASLR